MTSSPRIALVLETDRTYSRDILEGIRRYRAENGPWSTVVERVDKGKGLPDSLRKWSGEGMIVQTVSDKFATDLATLPMPKIELLSARYHSLRPFIGCDNRQVGTTVAQHFRERGYEFFASINVLGNSFFNERIDGFRNELGKAGYSITALPVINTSGPGDYETFQTVLIDALRQLPQPLAIFAANDRAGSYLLDACRRAGWAVPDDIAVMGCENDITTCEFSDPEMSSVAFNGIGVGYTAASWLEKLIAGKSPPPRPVLLPPRGIVIRESSDELVCRDSLVSRAVREIRLHLSENLTSGKLSSKLNCSRSTLERRMGKALGRSPAAELLRQRLKRACFLLEHSDHKVETIARQVGFAHGSHLQSTFRNTYGETPGQYRKHRKLASSL